MIKPLLLALTLIQAPAYDAAPSSIRVIDGDTVAWVGLKLRVLGLDTPELPPHHRCREEARAAARARLFVVELLDRAARVEIRPAGRDRYQRTLATILVDGRDLARLVIEAGHGRPYDGRTARRGWCP